MQKNCHCGTSIGSEITKNHEIIRKNLATQSLPYLIQTSQAESLIQWHFSLENWNHTGCEPEVLIGLFQADVVHYQKQYSDTVNITWVHKFAFIKHRAAVYTYHNSDFLLPLNRTKTQSSLGFCLRKRGQFYSWDRLHALTFLACQLIQNIVNAPCTTRKKISSCKN